MFAAFCVDVLQFSDLSSWLFFSVSWEHHIRDENDVRTFLKIIWKKFKVFSEQWMSLTSPNPLQQQRRHCEELRRLWHVELCEIHGGSTRVYSVLITAAEVS